MRKRCPNLLQAPPWNYVKLIALSIRYFRWSWRPERQQLQLRKPAKPRGERTKNAGLILQKALAETRLLVIVLDGMYCILRRSYRLQLHIQASSLHQMLQEDIMLTAYFLIKWLGDTHYPAWELLYYPAQSGS